MLMMFSVFSFAAEIPVRINDTAEVTWSVLPDTMNSNVSMKYSSDSFKSATDAMEKAAVIAKTQSDCTYRSYSVSPRYIYDDKKRVLDSYQGSISFSCSFTDIKTFDSVLNDVNSLAESDKRYELSVGSVYWSVSDEKMTKAKKDIRADVISEVYDMAKTFSSATNKICMANEITFEGASRPAAVFLESAVAPRSMNAKAFDTTAPEREEVDVSVRADFSLICK